MPRTKGSFFSSQLLLYNGTGCKLEKFLLTILVISILLTTNAALYSVTLAYADIATSVQSVNIHQTSHGQIARTSSSFLSAFLSGKFTLSLELSTRNLTNYSQSPFYLFQSKRCDTSNN